MNLKCIHYKNLDFKSFTILILIGSLILNHLNLDEKCFEYFRDEKLPSSINLVNFTRNEPIIFVGGFQNSGCSLMRVILDVHPLIRCTNSFSQLSFIIDSYAKWVDSAVEFNRLMHGGMTTPIIQNAVSSFFLEILVKHRDFAKNLCLKDKTFISNMYHLSGIFPNSKFILMIRDVRAVVYSTSGNTTIDKSTLKTLFINWNNYYNKAYSKCKSLGTKRCLPVFYERLVIKPDLEIRKIFKFLKIKWFDLVLNHPHFIGDIVSDQVKRPINTDSLYKWIGKINSNHSFIDEFAPLMISLGYDTKSIKPNYLFEIINKINFGR